MTATIDRPDEDAAVRQLADAITDLVADQLAALSPQAALRAVTVAFRSVARVLIKDGLLSAAEAYALLLDAWGDLGEADTTASPTIN